MTLRALRILFSFLVIPFATQAQTPASSLLWKVTGNGLSAPSYLYGTLHLLCKEDVHFSNTMKAAMDNSKVLYLELKFDDPDLVADMQKFISGGEGYSLKKVFKPEDYAALQQYMKDSLSADIMFFDAYKPFMIMSVLLQHMLPCKSPASIDVSIMGYVKAKAHPVLGIETVAEQMHAIDLVPDSIMIQGLMQMVKDPVKQKDIYNRMRLSYIAQDLDTLIAVASEDKSDAMENALLVDRNKHWIPILEKAMHTQSSFIAFGAMHLTGDIGIVNLLRKQGYTVMPIK